MTVKKLIKLLQKYPENSIVLILAGSDIVPKLQVELDGELTQTVWTPKKIVDVPI